jgi:hypothetical protein
LLLPVGVAGDDASEQVPHLQDGKHAIRPRGAGNFGIRPATVRVNAPDGGWISRAQVQCPQRIVDRLNTFIMRVCKKWTKGRSSRPFIVDRRKHLPPRQACGPRLAPVRRSSASVPPTCSSRSRRRCCRRP